MILKSEKARYGSEVKNALATAHAEHIIWGEELFDTKIILYPDKLKSIPGYAKIKGKLINAALVYFDFAKKQYIKSTIVRCDWDNEIIYIPEGNFNAIWRYLRKSVSLGIRIQQELGNDIVNNLPEEIVDLSLLQSRGCEAIIDNGKLSYIKREVPAEYIKMLGKKQSALDNVKYKYFYSALDDVYHDKSCELIKSIEPEHFMYSEEMPEGLRSCKVCRRKLFLREACSPYVKIIPKVDAVLAKGGIHDNNLEKYVYCYKFKFRIDNDGELNVIGAEDSWIIKGYKLDEFSLWHNNYVKTGEHERYITEGYHNQGVSSKRLPMLMEYIHSYAFEKHLAAEGQAEKEGLEIIKIDEIKHKIENKWIGKLVAFIQRLIRH